MSKLTALTRWVGPELEACELTHFERVTIAPVAAYAEHVAYLDAPRRSPLVAARSQRSRRTRPQIERA